MHFVVRADGGPEIGYGHLVRTGALASELLDRGHKVSYVTATPQNVREVCPADVDTVTIFSRTNPEPVCEFTRDYADITIVDSYLADGMYQKKLKKASSLVVVADDVRHRIAADVLVNGNLYAPELEYDVIGADPEWCLGPEYLLLRPEIVEYASMKPPWRDTPTRTVVTMGGSDIGELTPIVIHAFEGTDLRVDAIVGPGFSIEQEKKIKKAANEVSANVNVVRDPDDLPKRMFRADFAVTTASTTTYELLALGTPVVNLPVVDNQKLIADALRKHDAATVLENTANVNAFSDAISNYVNDIHLRRKRREVGLNLVDGHGVDRVYREVLSAANSNQNA